MQPTPTPTPTPTPPPVRPSARPPADVIVINNNNNLSSCSTYVGVQTVGMIMKPASRCWRRCWRPMANQEFLKFFTRARARRPAGRLDRPASRFYERARRARPLLALDDDFGVTTQRANTPPPPLPPVWPDLHRLRHNNIPPSRTLFVFFRRHLNDHLTPHLLAAVPPA